MASAFRVYAGEERRRGQERPERVEGGAREVAEGRPARQHRLQKSSQKAWPGGKGGGLKWRKPKSAWGEWPERRKTKC